VSFTISKRNDTTVVGVEGQLVIANRQELRQTVVDALERGERKFLIDFSHTGYIDSSGLGVLVSLMKKVRERDGELRLAHLNDDLRSLFELTKLDTLFRLGEDGGGAAGAGARAPVRPPPHEGGAEEIPPGA